MPVSFLFLSQSEILNLTLSLFLGGTCKKLLELWHCFVLRCARERPYLPRVIVNMLWIGDIQPIRAASGALTSFAGERKKYSQSHPVAADHPNTILSLTASSQAVQMLFHGIWLISEYVQQFMMLWGLIFCYPLTLERSSTASLWTCLWLLWNLSNQCCEQNRSLSLKQGRSSREPLVTSTG